MWEAFLAQLWTKCANLRKIMVPCEFHEDAKRAAVALWGSERGANGTESLDFHGLRSAGSFGPCLVDLKAQRPLVPVEAEAAGFGTARDLLSTADGPEQRYWFRSFSRQGGI